MQFFYSRAQLLSIADQAGLREIPSNIPERRVEMDKIFTAFRSWLAWLRAYECEQDDPLTRMSPRELADLPVMHPRSDRCSCG
jgi:hypothetical protein